MNESMLRRNILLTLLTQKVISLCVFSFVYCYISIFSFFETYFLFCWYWWNCWVSMFKHVLSCHNFPTFQRATKLYMFMLCHCFHAPLY